MDRLTARHNRFLHAGDPQQQAEQPFQCRHIFTGGHRCASPCLRGENFCYYHHTTRKPVATADLAARKARRSRRGSFTIPVPEDRSSIQHAIGQVLQQIAANDLDPRRAGLLLYGLQIASLNLPRPNPKETPASTVEEVVDDPALGLVGKEARLGDDEPLSSAERLLLDLTTEPNPEPVVPNIQAVAEPAPLAEVSSMPRAVPSRRPKPPSSQPSQPVSSQPEARCLRRSGETPAFSSGSDASSVLALWTSAKSKANLHESKTLRKKPGEGVTPFPNLTAYAPSGTTT